MYRMEQATETSGGRGGDRKRVQMVVEALATLRSQGESLSEVAHDARNMVTALGLYCDLLDEPGVLATPYSHYGNELRLVAAASRRLVEKLVDLDAHSARQTAPPAGFGVAPGDGSVVATAKAEPEAVAAPEPEQSASASPLFDQYPPPQAARDAKIALDRKRRWDFVLALPVANLAAELLGNRNLLSALAGPSIGLTMDADGGARPVRLTGEDLTRVLVNLVKNAAEAMPAGGRIHIGLSESSPSAPEGSDAQLILRIEDNGPGIPEDSLRKIFTSGYTTHEKGHGSDGSENGVWPVSHRGLGLAIARSIVETAGGRISVQNREPGGARFEIQLPVHQARF